MTKAWSLSKNSRNVVDIWQSKVRYFRKLAKGWSANLEADIRKHKKEIKEEYDALDIKSQSFSLIDAERGRLDEILRELNSY